MDRRIPNTLKDHFVREQFNRISRISRPLFRSVVAFYRRCNYWKLHSRWIISKKRENSGLIELYDENHWRSASLSSGFAFCIREARVARGRAEINRDGTFALTSRLLRILYPRVASRHSKIRLNKNTAVLNQYISLFDPWLQRVAH